MKNTLFSAMAILAMTFFSMQAYSQETQGQPSGPEIVSNHSISMTILGLEYGYEQRLGGHWSILGRAGIVPQQISLYSDPSTTSVSIGMALGATIEPRLYTSIGRRNRMGRSTFNNSSDFVSFRNLLIPHEDGMGLMFIPMYGIRRCGGIHWAHEFTFGPRLYISEDSGLGFHIQYRLAFVF
jgi:hypothetical protein